MQSSDENMDPSEGVYQHIDSTKEIWKALQDMTLGSDRDRWSIHEHAREVFQKDHRTSATQTMEEEATVGFITPAGTGVMSSAPTSSTALPAPADLTDDQGTKRKATEEADEERLGGDLPIPHLKDIRKSHNPDVILLVETKHVDSYVKQLAKDLGYQNVFVVSANGSSGGVAVFWSERVRITMLDNPTLYCTNMCIQDGTNTFWMSYIYGNLVAKYRKEQWNGLIQSEIAGYLKDKPRLLVGDFNDIKNGEKKGGIIRSIMSCSLFNRLISILGVHDIKTLGGKYTWMGKRSKYTIIYDSRWRLYPKLKEVMEQAWMMHNALPVASNLNKRGCRLNTDCQVCGEGVEDIKHMLLECKVSKEIWSLSLLDKFPEIEQNSTVQHFLQRIVEQNTVNLDHTLPFFLGWRIWKMRNKVIYENKRDHIVQVIRAAWMDKQ
ncbi:hypothetical protein IGI04_002391 [Brassica rapa subsp. trilocularis]|uniref:Reverse transcriptase zinc-binding domain-containing protein n=1 Tax=Brassica rapa subsp. trilocularis TaxID=1813537 RepID=A0ABQ7NYR1_BRACM|nr:hypothetical protein IGI04_002391 [Brassica rapa subsp. trilocularis]